MKLVDEYRDSGVVLGLSAEIRRCVTRSWTLMEICGGQTHSIVKNGLEALLPDGIELVHGPGCPVCVTPVELIDAAIQVAARPGVVFTSFGDMLRVPGSKGSLLEARAAGATYALFTRRSTRSSSPRPNRRARWSSSQSVSKPLPPATHWLCCRPTR